MLKINLDFQLKNLEGNEIEGAEAHVGKLVANMLASSTEGKAIKMLDWALTLYRKEVIELDTTDKDFLVSFIETSKALTNLGKAQILTVIKKAEAAEEEKKNTKTDKTDK